MKRHFIDLVLLGLIGLFVLIGLLVLFYTLTPLPSVETIESIKEKQSIILLDRNDEFLFDFSNNEKRTLISIDDISENIIKATLAIEDETFFEHRGIRLDAFIRATIANISSLSFVQGGSTITQQVIKNVFLTNEKKIERKLKEFILAPKLEKELTKQQILEIYFNTIAYGGVIYGVDEATNVFFSKSPGEVTIAEAAYLAAIPKAPTFYSPYGSNKTQLEIRKQHILERMFNLKLITREEYREAVAEKVFFQQQSRFQINAPHFVFFVKSKLEEQYGGDLSDLEGKNIKTTIDLKLQKDVEKIVEDFRPRLDALDANNVAALVLDVKNGDILTMVGSKDYFDREIDGGVNVINSLRQPGSTFKPFSYVKALEKGLSPDTIIFDVPTQFSALCEKDIFVSDSTGCYAPVNYTGDYTGPVSLRNALARSINIPAVKVLYLANIGDVLDMVKNWGITTLDRGPQHYGLSLVLGGGEVRPIELANAYSVFANDGLFVPYKYLYDTKTTKERVIDSKYTKQINDILSDKEARAPVFGQNSLLGFSEYDVAAKTGTTNNSRDIWVVGYTKDILVLVWGGNTKGEALAPKASGASLSSLFHNILALSVHRYGNKNNFFVKNLSVSDPISDRVDGVVDEEGEIHSILHYINKRNFANTSLFEDEPQYESWEYGVLEWLEKTGFKNINTNIETISENLSIISPREKILSAHGTHRILVNRIGDKGTRYEFYINGKLTGTSHLPIYSFVPSAVGIVQGNIKVRVVANTSLGVYITEEEYLIGR